MNSAPESPGRPRLLIISASVGGGHNAAARAILAELERRGGNVHAEMVDALDFTPGWFRAYYAGGYALAVSRFPWLYGLGFRLTNLPRGTRRAVSEKLRLAWERLHTRRLVRYVADWRPDVILHTHFLAPPVLGRRIAAGALPARQFVAVTDNDAHRWWYAESVERYFLPAELTRRSLDRWDVPAERSRVTGMPIHPKWTRPLPPRAEILKQWNLPDRRIVLLSGGTEFVCGPVLRIARQLAAACPDACVVVLGGRNKRLLGRLSALPEVKDRRIVPQGFTDRAHELAEVCELMITKAGGATTAECLSKGVPMVLLKPVPGQERDNARHFARHGAATIARGAAGAVAEARRLLKDAAAREKMSAAAHGLYLPGAGTIVEELLAVLNASVQSRPTS